MSDALAKCRFWVLISILLGLSACSQPDRSHKLKPGDAVADLALHDLKGNRVSLVTVSNKIQIINIWATWCAPCRYEMPSLDNLKDILGTRRYVVVGVSVDDDDHLVREFLIERKIEFDNYLDPNLAEVKEKLGIRVLPSTLIVSPQGKLLKLIEGGLKWDTPDMIEMIRGL